MLKLTEATRIRVPIKGTYALKDIQKHTGEANIANFY
jgi:hypothetical protein